MHVDDVASNICQGPICRGPPLAVLRAVGLLDLFPELEGLGDSPPPPGSGPGSGSGTGRAWRQQRAARHSGGGGGGAWDYFAHVSSLNQLLHMATQLQRDAPIAANHKYLAHQIALLYQCLNAVRGESKPFKRRIEEQFDAVKAGPGAGPRGAGGAGPGTAAALST